MNLQHNGWRIFPHFALQVYPISTSYFRYIYCKTENRYFES